MVCPDVVKNVIWRVHWLSHQFSCWFSSPSEALSHHGRCPHPPEICGKLWTEWRSEKQLVYIWGSLEQRYSTDDTEPMEKPIISFVVKALIELPLEVESKARLLKPEGIISCWVPNPGSWARLVVKPRTQATPTTYKTILLSTILFFIL